MRLVHGTSSFSPSQSPQSPHSTSLAGASEDGFRGDRGRLDQGSVGKRELETDRSGRGNLERILAVLQQGQEERHRVMRQRQRERERERKRERERASTRETDPATNQWFRAKEDHCGAQQAVENQGERFYEQQRLA